MQPEITSARQIRGMKMTKFLPALSGLLNPGETSFLIGSTDTWVPAADTFVLTTQRLLVMMGKNLTKAHSWREISGFTAAPEKRGLKVFLRSDDPYNINRLKPEDHAALQAALEVFPTMGPGSEAWNAWVQRRTALLSAGHALPFTTAANSVPLSPVAAKPGSPGPSMPFSAAPPSPAYAPAQSAVEAPYAPPQGFLSPPEAAPDRSELLKQLDSLHRYGVLTDDEYSAATARLLSQER